MSLAVKSARMATQGAGRVRPGVGDPGLFSAIGGALKSVAGVVAPVAAGLATGGIGGALLGGASRLLGGGRGPSAIAAPPPQLPAFVPGPGVGRVGRTVQALVPGGKTGFEGLKLACPSGFHPNKSDYFLKDGTFVPKGSRCVKNRTRNPLNPRALRRAVSRIDAGKVWQEKMRGIETDKFTKAGKRKSC